MKKIFYYTDVLPFLGEEKKALNKLIYNLSIFRSACSDIQLIWHPWSLTEEYLEKNGSHVLDDYKCIVRDYIDEGWGILDTCSSLDEAKRVLLDCDAYYGDISDLTYEAQNAGIPVMLQNIDIWEQIDEYSPL